DNVLIFGLRNIKKCDIEYIKGKLGKTVRYVGTAEKVADKVSAFVEPLIIGADSLFSSVKTNNNMISLVGDNVGQLSFFGQGAGKYPTGTAVAQDVIDIVNGERSTILPGNKIDADNSVISKQYYIRTTAAVPADIIESIDCVDSVNYIITKNVSTSDIHKISEEILSKDGESFFAGIER
ncbi:MAG: hypothetical protein J6Q69_03450, partial [Clostridia bacterium]|nr:hypothetical protein [Clostridia bacterium]